MTKSREAVSYLSDYDAGDDAWCDHCRTRVSDRGHIQECAFWRRAGKLKAAMLDVVGPKLVGARLFNPSPRPGEFDWDADVQERALRYWDRARAGRTDGLLLAGPVGTGKTSLSAAFVRMFWLQGLSVSFEPARGFFRQVRDTYRKDSKLSETDVVERLSGVDMLVIDDLGREGGVTDHVRSVLQEVIDTRSHRLRQTIITTNLGRGDIDAIYGDAIGSRLYQYQVMYLDGPDRRRRKP